MPTIGGFVVATGSQPQSGRRLFREVIDELSAPIDGDDSTVRRLASDAFRAAVRTMNRRGSWPWEYREQTIAMNSNVSTSSVTDLIKKPLSMHYIDPTNGRPWQRIGYVPVDKFRERFAINFSGRPFQYTVPDLFDSGTVEWFPIPSTTDSCRFAYYRMTPVPRIEDEALEIPENASEVYTAYAWAEFMKRLPSAQQPMPLVVALSEARTAFKEFSAHVVAPGDRSRSVDVIHG